MSETTGMTAQGLYLAPPHGELIASGTKVAIAKGRPMGLEGDWILLSGDKAYGHMRVGQPEPVDLENFRARRSEHGVSEKERRRWWPERSPLYLYPVERFRAYPAGPVEVSLPPGRQTRVDTKGLGLPGEMRVKVKARRSSSGRWRTLKNGRRVLITTGSLVSRKVKAAMKTASLQVWTLSEIRKPPGQDEGNEYGMYIDNEGKQINGTLAGGEHSVSSGDLYNHEDAHVFVHNHPNGSSFSDGDIHALSAESSLEHLIAIGHEGSMYRMTKTDRTLTPRDVAKDFEDYFSRSDAQEIEREVRRRGGDARAVERVKARNVLHRMYELDMEDRMMDYGWGGDRYGHWLESTHEVVKGITSYMGLDYERVTVERGDEDD